MNRDLSRPPSAFSLIEALLAACVVTVLATVAIISVGKIKTSGQEVKLNHDLKALNSAVNAYLSFGGKIEDSDSVEDILRKLKTQASANSASQVVGFSQSYLDNRLVPVMQTQAEATTEMSRIYWDGSSMSFKTAIKGPAGIKEFRFIEEPGRPNQTFEERHTVVKYSKDGTWIWDYEDANAPKMINPTQVALSPSAPPDPSPAPIQFLQPPILSPPGGDFSISEFDVTVEITNPNPPGSSTLAFALDFGDWVPLMGNELQVSAGQTLEVLAVPVDENLWSSSGAAVGTFNAKKPVEEFIEEFASSGLGDYTWMVFDSADIVGASTQLNGKVGVAPNSSLKVNVSSQVPSDLTIDPTASLGGASASPQVQDLSSEEDAAKSLNAAAAALNSTQSFGNITATTVINGIAPDGMNVITIDTAKLNHTGTLTIQAVSPSDYFIINITGEMSLLTKDSLVINGTDPSHVLFNIMPDATFTIGGNGWQMGATVLAPESKVVMSGTATLSGAVYSGPDSRLQGNATLTNATVFGH